MAMVGINLDSAPDQSVMDEIRQQDFVDEAHYLYLPILHVPEKLA